MEAPNDAKVPENAEARRDAEAQKDAEVPKDAEAQKEAEVQADAEVRADLLHAGQKPELHFRYLRTLRSTTGHHWTLGGHLRASALSTPKRPMRGIRHKRLFMTV